MSQMPANREVLTVSALTKSARRVLEGEFPMIFVEGEISNFSMPASGHWYFTLKDAKSQIRCAMFKGRNRMIRFVPRNGLQIVVRGKISLYEGRGEFQMITEFMEEAGDGDLRRSFDRLKAQLESEGLFETKKELPSMVQHLAIITSPTGAAVRDVLHVLKRRFPAIRVTILPVPVQGEDSTPQIVKSLAFANNYQDDPFDVILLTRGGGSLEDLWSFNTEPVARAIHESNLPVVSAIGHETDFTIADFVADLRAPTPSAAAEVLSPDTNTWLNNINQIELSLTRAAKLSVQQLSSQLKHLQRRLRHPGQRLQDLHQRLDDMEARLRGALQQYLSNMNFDNLGLRLTALMRQKLERENARLTLLTSQLVSPQASINQHTMLLQQLQQRLQHQSQSVTVNAQNRLSQVATRLDAISPLKTLQRGYAIVTEADSSTNVIKSTTNLNVGDKVNVQLMQDSFTAEVTELKHEAEGAK